MRFFSSAFSSLLFFSGLSSIYANTPPSPFYGYYAWSYGSGSFGPAAANVGISFSGFGDAASCINNAQQAPGGSNLGQLRGQKWLTIGGGNAAGSFSVSTVQALAGQASTISAAGFVGVMLDIEIVNDPASSIIPAFKSAFAALKAAGLSTGITTSHSAPYQVAASGDGYSLVSAWVADSNLDIISPQLYTTGNEVAPDFEESGSCSNCWPLYKGSLAQVAPSIAIDTQYSQVQQYFSSTLGITTAGYVAWQQYTTNPGPAGQPTTTPVTQAPSGGGTCGSGNIGNGQCSNGQCCSIYGWCGVGTAYCGTPTSAPATSAATTAPPAGSTGCGNGNKGNGVCAGGLCCSPYGWCGTGAGYCAATPSPTQYVPPATTKAPVISGTCGNGNRGNGLCSGGLCCSQYGWCGTGSAYCSGSSGITAAPTQPPAGTCGGGNVGNGRCPNTALCCSQYGWCGTGAAYGNCQTVAALTNITVPQTAPVSGANYLGCIKDSTTRIFTAVGQSKTAMTAALCIETAVSLNAGYLYAGVEGGVECWASKTSPNPTLTLPSTSCSFMCPGAYGSSQYCGGSYAIDVFDISQVPNSVATMQAVASVSLQPYDGTAGYETASTPSTGSSSTIAPSIVMMLCAFIASIVARFM